VIIGGHEIQKQLAMKQIVIEPFDPNCIGPNSYDLHLSPHMAKLGNKVLDFKTEDILEPFEIFEEGYVLEPGELYLGSTLEYTETANMVPMIEGVSSVARKGLSIHVTAGFGDVGFKGNWTLEISCLKPVRIYPGMRIAQIYYHIIYGSYTSYDSPDRKSKYSGSKGLAASQSYKEFEAIK
jgi:dCTP deaminase